MSSPYLYDVRASQNRQFDEFFISAKALDSRNNEVNTEKDDIVRGARNKKI